MTLNGATTLRQAMDNGADVIFAGGATGNGGLIEIDSEAEAKAESSVSELTWISGTQYQKHNRV